MRELNKSYSEVSTSLFIFSIFMLTLLPSAFAQQEEFKTDCIGSVSRVIDGDTIDIEYAKAFSQVGAHVLSGEGNTFKVRFADVDAPEIETVEGKAAKSELNSLIAHEEVILDIDDKYTYDLYGERIVAVVYVRVDETKIMNVNFWLANQGYAEISDYDNEFEPDTWSLYLEETSPSPTKSPTVTHIPEKEDCFIAAVAYGSPTIEKLNILRDFRDNVIEKNPGGRTLVNLYYIASPPIADFISRNDNLRVSIRSYVVHPLGEILEVTQNIWGFK